MKLPAFQFYPADWRKDSGVQALSRHDRSVWFDMLCIMHESEERGNLILAGQPMPEDALSMILNLDKQILTTTLTTLLTYGVARRRQEDGAIYSKRMVQDENLIQIRREAGKKGGNPALLNQNPKQKPTTPVKQIPTPSFSSSSSISSSDNKEEPPNPQGGILPDGWKKLTKAEQGRKKVNLNTPEMIRIGKFFGQRETTLWTIAEYLALYDVNPTKDEIELIGQHYSLVLENNGYRHTSLITLLNNWPAARNRAAAYFMENPDHRNA